MSKKIFFSVIAVAMAVLLASLVMICGFLYGYYGKLQVKGLRDELNLACAGVRQSGISYFEDFASTSFRFTLISPDGTVLYDSQAELNKMDNHLEREEISEAFETGYGSSARYSATLTEKTFYEARLLDDGNVLRISAIQMTIGALLMGMSPAICAIVLLSVIIAVVLSQKTAKSIVKPLETLDLDNPENNDTYEELTPVLLRLGGQHRQIVRQIGELKRKTDEMAQITSSMKEGLVILDSKGTVLSMNEAAKDLFNVSDCIVGEPFLKADRSDGLRSASEKALEGKRSDFREKRGDAEYRFIISPTESGDAVTGVVILCIDVTDALAAERSRREFTANVSHELKTPLQAIIGSAELLENGLVKPCDTGRFIGNIKKEASHLVDLINDIIRLSRLDEKSEIPIEEVNLYKIATEAVGSLQNFANERNVAISLEGEECVVKGCERYLYEIIYNLCDNAVRYNKDGGKVSVSVSKRNGREIIEISDTGIGIPPEHKERIFERFYRVDKSHSRETGGTGLGLSIVKHAAAFHGAEIKLESTQGVGTTVTVTF